ncbi:MAG: PH domain-containing protein [Mycobacteriales bacterium]
MEKVRFGPERTTLAVVVVMTLGALPLALSSWWLAPALLVPLGALVWVLRARVVAMDAGLEVCNGLGVRRLPWQEVEGFDVPDRGPVRLLRAGGKPLPMTALSRRELHRLLELARPA